MLDIILQLIACNDWDQKHSIHGKVVPYFMASCGKALRKKNSTPQAGDMVMHAAVTWRQTPAICGAF